MDFELTHARHDPIYCLAPGLFRNLKRGARKQEKLDVSYSYGASEQIRFVGFEQLGCEDMRLLQGLVAFAGPRGIILTAEPAAKLPRQLRLLLRPKLSAASEEGLVVRVSITRLLAEVGLSDGGANIRAAKACLVRMSNVTLIVNSFGRQATFQMMSHVFDEHDGALLVCLNPGITNAVLGRKPYSHLEMPEVRRLTSSPARFVHQRLSGWIDPGKSGRVGLDTLCSYIYGDSTNTETMKKRRQSARKALAELGALGWRLNEYTKGKWEICRPRIGPRDEGLGQVGP